MCKTRLVLLPILLLLILIGGPSQAEPAEAIVPGVIRLDVTYQNIGALWWIEGDADLDSLMTLEFRRSGEGEWRAGAPAMRAYPTVRVQDGPLGLNYWAASALFLQAGESYELRLTLTDPDGGGGMRIVTAITRSEPVPDDTGRRLYVIPGDGGGDGSQANPFRGLQTAADAAQPGDVFRVADGIYSPFQLLVSGTSGRPISFLGPLDGTAILDGAGTDRGIVTLGEYDQPIGHVILQGLTLENGRWGIDAQRSHDITIRHNVIRDVDYGVINRRDHADEGNQTVCDNVVEGRTPWPGSGIPAERGIDLRGYGNIVCFNRVRHFGDCISVQPFTGPSYGNDVYGNDISHCVDDGIEIDYNQANARVWRNRVMNSRMGVSVQPVRGGPAYIYRNEFFNLESVPIKMHNYTTGFFVVHNTGIKHGNGYGDNGAMWRNVVLRNNLFLGTRYAFEFTTQPDEGFRDFDYGAWGTSREIDPGGPFFKWDNVRYERLGDLPVGVEDHGIEVGFGDLVNPTLPSAWDVAAVPGSRDLRLQDGAPAVNAGTHLANLNDGFALSGPPDIGAFEYGLPLPNYGPRLLEPDLSASKKKADRPMADYGETVAFTVVIRNTGAPLSGTVFMTDVVPSALRYVNESLAATSGAADDDLAPVLVWSGDMSATATVTVTYAATVSTDTTQLARNTAWIKPASLDATNRSATIMLNGGAVYIPVIVKHQSD